MPTFSRPSLLGLSAALALTWIVCAGVRLVELPAWQGSAFEAGGEPIMATHDAYVWLAGAKGVGVLPDAPLSRLVRLVHALTPASWGGVGFWLPPLVAAFSGLPLVVLARRWGASAFGPAAGVVGGCALGFLIRTRLAMLDTDILALFTLTLAAVWLCLLLEPLLRFGDGAAGTGEDAAGPSPGFWGGLGGLCLWTIVSVWFYGSIQTILMAVFGSGAALGVVLARPGRRTQILVATCLPLACLHTASWAALAAVPAVCAAFWRFPGLSRRPAVLWAAAGAGLLAFAIFGSGFAGGVVERVLYWFKPAVDEARSAASVSALSLPSVLPSIREAQNSPFSDILRVMAGHPALFPVLLAGYVWLALRRPVALVFLPLLLLGLASAKLGMRFSMYGAPAMGAGMIGLGLLTARFIPRPLPALVLAAAGLCVALVPPAYVLRRAPPSPALSRPFAETLLELGRATPSSAWIWLWWDFGYAVQYYAERFPVADGARHTEHWLYPLAAVHAAEPARAAALMRFFAAEMAVQDIPSEARRQVSGDSPFLHAFTPPMARLLEMQGAAARAVLDRLDGEGGTAGAGASLPEQDYVVSWDNLRLAGWIIRFGTWDLADGAYKEGNVTRLEGELRVDPAKGAAMSSKFGNLPLATLDVATPNGVKRYSWPRLSGVHLVMNNAAREAYIMNDTAYRSSMVQMLLGEPASFARDFELVLDNAPAARVYRLKPRPEEGRE